MRKLTLFIFFFLFFFNKCFADGLKFSKIIELENPWGSTFINEKQLLITELDGKIKLVNLNDKEITEIKHNINYLVDGQGGLLDIIYKNKFVWVSYSENRGSGRSNTSIVKGKFNKKKINFKNIFRAKPAIKNGNHWGSRLAIKENFLYASIGDRGGGLIAQDPTNHAGKIIRIHLDGSIPNDNPKFKNKSNWLPEIYQIGVRNPQGLALSEYNGKIYASNHGPMGGDWFGEIKKGENYGWKILGWGGRNYDGTPIGPKWKPGFTKAIRYWVPSIAASAITIYKGKEFEEWNGHALITSLKDKSLRKLIFLSTPEIQEEIIFKDKIGRIRDIQVHPVNGKIYFLAGNSLWLMEKTNN
ncbi:PQQ-dependent sugar dehydrogenase [Candidatus Pelagibacter bacterium]|nr:PQQ-dependent sugar dehydrogenase [Candidatus Pelagibacter bacterium]